MNGNHSQWLKDGWRRAASVGQMESRTEGEDGWSDGYSSGPVFKRQLSKAQLSQHNSTRVCGVPPAPQRLLTNVCGWRESVCLSERCGVAPFGEVLVLSPPLRCRSFLPPELQQAECARRDAALSAYLTLSLARAPSALFSLARSHRARSLAVHPPSPSPPPRSCHHPPTS